MQLAGLSYVSAPQASGHPLSLPGAQDPKLAASEVRSTTGPQKSPAQTQFQRPTQTIEPAPVRQVAYAFQAEPDPVTHNPPPSIMQIKITQMLQDQASVPKPEEPLLEPKATAKPEADTTDGAVQKADTRAAKASTTTPTATEAINAQDTEGVAQPALDTTPKPSPEPKQVVETAQPVPERAPMSMPIRATSAAPSQSQNSAMAPSAYEETANLSRKPALSTLPG